MDGLLLSSAPGESLGPGSGYSRAARSWVAPIAPLVRRWKGLVVNEKRKLSQIQSACERVFLRNYENVGISPRPVFGVDRIRRCATASQHHEHSFTSGNKVQAGKVLNFETLEKAIWRHYVT